ncbi:hypothetical protein SK128_014286, partial [Halocaridina rubra]
VDLLDEGSVTCIGFLSLFDLVYTHTIHLLSCLEGVTFPQSFENGQSYSSTSSDAVDTTEANSMKIVARDKETRQQQLKQYKLQTETGDNPGCEEKDTNN